MCSVRVAFDLVLPQMFPCAKLFTAFFAGILSTPLGLLFRRPAICHVVADEPFCYPYQASVVADRLYIEIWVLSGLRLMPKTQFCCVDFQDYRPLATQFLYHCFKCSTLWTAEPQQPFVSYVHGRIHIAVEPSPTRFTPELR